MLYPVELRAGGEPRNEDCKDEGGRKMVGVAGFELATYWSQTSCATRLRYAPNKLRLYPVKRSRRGGRRQHQLTRHRDALLDVLFAHVFQR